MTARQQERLIRSILKDLGLKDFVTIITSKRHFRLQFQNGEKKCFVTAAKTPSDYRDRLNMTADIRRAGMAIGLLNREATT